MAYSLVYWAMLKTSISPAATASTPRWGSASPPWKASLGPASTAFPWRRPRLSGATSAQVGPNLARGAIRRAFPIVTGLGVLATLAFYFAGSFLTGILAESRGHLSTNATDEADGEAEEEASAPTMTGVWSGTFGTGVAFAMDLTQTGDAITGTYSTGALGGNVSGSISGNALNMTVTVPGGATSEWTGAANDTRTSMNGSFTIVAGGGGSGTWSATK